LGQFQEMPIRVSKSSEVQVFMDEQQAGAVESPRRGRAGGTFLVVFSVFAVLAIAVPAAAQYESGYPGGYPGGDPGGGGYDGVGAGRVELELTAKKKQRSIKAVKAKATCRNRACMVDAKGKLKAGDRKGKLKPKEGVAVAAGDTEKLKLKLAKKAQKAAKAAARDDQRTKVTIRARATGVGGGGSDKAKVTVKLKP
jgi:hypothetical protein